MINAGALVTTDLVRGRDAAEKPGLDAYGNSVRGVRVCQEVSRLGLHVFAGDAEDAILYGAAPASDGPARQ